MSARFGRLAMEAVEWVLITVVMLCHAAGFVIGVAAVSVAIILPIRQFIHHYDVADCRNFSVQSGYETKFAQYTWMTWDCLAKTDNGKWVSTQNLHGVNQ